MPRHALAGLQAGVVGAIFMILWTAIGSLWTRRSVWMIPNLYATTFYGSRAYVNGFTRGSWIGVALMVFVCGIGGVVWGLFWSLLGREERRYFLVFFGAIAGLVAYWVLFKLVFRAVSPLIPLYAPDAQIRIGYLVWGITLSRSAVYSRRISDNSGVAST